MNKGTFYVVGVGPGDPELMTLKATKILDKCPAWLAPAARKNGDSTALTIVNGAMQSEGKDILIHHFPMKKVLSETKQDSELQDSWEAAALWVNEKLEKGLDVALPTLGDPAIYCTGFYVCETLLAKHPDVNVEIVPGISAIGATAAAAKTPLCLGDDKLVVIPAVFENGDLRETLETFDSMVFMKVYKSMDRLVPLLKEMNLLDKAVLVERTSMGAEQVHHDLESLIGKELHYFSTLIVRKRK